MDRRLRRRRIPNEGVFLTSLGNMCKLIRDAPTDDNELQSNMLLLNDSTAFRGTERNISLIDEGIEELTIPSSTVNRRHYVAWFPALMVSQIRSS